MSSFDYTVELERALLKIIVNSAIMCRMYIHRLRDEMFSSQQRKFILAVALEIFNTTKAMLTKTVFEYEVGSKIPDNEQATYIGEWNLIEAFATDEPPDVLIDKLSEADVGRKVLAAGTNITALLEQGRIPDAVSYLKQTAVSLQLRQRDRPIVELRDYKRRKTLILEKRANPEKYLGIKTGLPMFDARTGGLFGGELTLLAGLTGSGKSTVIKLIERNIVILNPNKNVLHIANEEYQEQVENKFDSNFTGIPYFDFKNATITDEDMEKWEYLMKEWPYGGVFMKEVPAFTDVTLAEQAHRELENKGIHIDLIIIDHLPHIKPIQQAWSENDELKKAASDCKELARSLHLPVFVPTQAATVVSDKQEKGKRAGKLDVYGSKGQVHVANLFLILTEQGRDESDPTLEDWEKDVFLLADVKKNRDGPPFSFRLKHYVKTGVLQEIAMEEQSGKKTGPISKGAKKKADEALEDIEKEKLAEEPIPEEGTDSGTDENEEAVSEPVVEKSSLVEFSQGISDKPKSFVSPALLEKFRNSSRKT